MGAISNGRLNRSSSMRVDDRGVGGRQLVELELYTMRRKVLNARSSVRTHKHHPCMRIPFGTNSQRPVGGWVAMTDRQ